MRWLVALLLVCSVVAHAQERAHAGAVPYDPLLDDPFPIAPPVRRPEVDAALALARGELRACLEAEGVGRGTVRVLVSAEHALTVTPRTTPRDAEAEACLDVVVRQHVTPLLARAVGAIRTTVRVDQEGVPRPDRSRYSAELHDALATVEPALAACRAGHPAPGVFTVRASATDAGVVSIDLAWSGRGRSTRRAGPAVLACLRAAVGSVRIAPGSARQADREVPTP